MSAQPYISPESLARLEAQQRLQRLAAEAHLATRAVERVLRARSFQIQPIGEVEATVIREEIDAANNALTQIWQELDQA